MNYILILTLAILSGCAGPKFLATNINDALIENEPKIRVVHDEKTRAGFEKAMVKWLDQNLMPYELVPSSSVHQPNFLTLEYTGRWSWDMGLFLADAQIKASHQGDRVGIVQFLAPNTLNPSKYGNAEERIGYMMDVLFGYQTAEAATASIN
jgi:hypothetical protein